MAGATTRAYGGSGFSLRAFPVVVEAHRSRRVSVEFGQDLDAAAQEQLRSIVRSLVKRGDTRVSVVVRSMPPQHVGLGSKTTLLLATITVVRAVQGVSLCIDDIQRLSGRGGASGIGINTFFTGGFVVDAGHDPSRGRWAPSGASDSYHVPKIISRLPIPADWKFTLLLPEGTRYAGGSEVDFFRRHTPTARSAALTTLAVTYHGVAAAVALRDLDLLSRSLCHLHATGFKRAEVFGQPQPVRRTLHALQRVPHCAAGMSSMGPLLYAVTVGTAAREAVSDIAREQRIRVLGTFRGNNTRYALQNE